MNAFSLKTMFVAKSSGVATTGSTQDLTPGQIGVFLPNYAVANAGNIAAADYFYIAQGRIEQVPGLGSKRSDKISPKKVIKWYKVTPEDTAANKIIEVSNFSAKCGDEVVLTIRLESNDINVGFYNGLQRSFIALAPCCDCGETPCEDIEAADLEALVDDLVAKINGTSEDAGAMFNGTDVRVSDFVTAQRLGSGATSTIRIEGKPLPAKPILNDMRANQYQVDRLDFNVYVTKGADTTMDPLYMYDRCEQEATITVVQNANYTKGSSAEIALMEQRTYSYQTSVMKDLLWNKDWNGAFTSYVEPGQYYDVYYIIFKDYDDYGSWNDKVPMDNTVIVAFKTGDGTAFESVLTAALGSPSTSINGPDVSTTTTSTTSTTTSTTTQP